jgi:hypothetical protein
MYFIIRYLIDSIITNEAFFILKQIVILNLFQDLTGQLSGMM